MTLTLSSLPEGYRAAVFGASGGIGAAMLEHFEADPRCGTVHAGARSVVTPGAAKTRPFGFDLTDEDSIAAAAEQIAAGGPLHLCLVATGMLHDETGLEPEKTWRQIDARAMARAFQINATGPALIAKHVLPFLAKDDKAVFAAISARVGSISDNRLGGWHAYRASKAALNQILKTCSIELARKRPEALCVGLHPGTVDTALSAPFQRNVPETKLFTPAYSAERLLSVIDGLDAAATGRVFDWAGEEVAA
ncbi:short-chain dehydrogenase [Marinicauda salina]|uniref:Short-chain dehydrogenase n=1 Tax=Marinicauda salina TaxID=2135793 RepID=A0A2U2BRX2_9PROT|nr:SDR family NAD(P)-dependent oxidoreductase [Marinicauda salina]PWE16745.1 short-chain dehydrogenase [Marinicauda salina]